MTNNFVSFDIFDTALLRCVYKPTDLFFLIEKEVGNDFYSKRIEAEKKAREENPFYNLSDIYKFLPEFKEKTEISFEIESCYANHSILKQYNKLKQSGINCIFISDMYLSSNILESMLKNAGYKDPKVYVSCEMQASKVGGKLFKEVLKEINGNILCHTGDNYVADIEGAKLAGIENVAFYPALHNKNLSLPAVKNSILKKYLALTLNQHNFNALDKLAYFITPVMYQFTRWVLSQRKEGQKIFFLSRDMKMPYRIATEMFEQKDVYYLYASRHSLASICMQSDNEELKKHLSVIYDEIVVDLLKAQNAKNAINYLKQFDIRDDDIIVDIGYSGTIQAAINEALGVKTQGLYMQTTNLIDGLKTKQFLTRPVMEYYLMLEFPFGSDEDCIEGYSEDGKVLFSPENNKRKELAKYIYKVMEKCLNTFRFIDVELSDIEQILIHLQYYCNDDIIQIYNEKIYSNRGLDESIINFDKQEILNGNLRKLYNHSYCQPLFKKLLESDKDLKHLTKLLP